MDESPREGLPTKTPTRCARITLMKKYPETTMSEYIAGFDAGYDYVLTEIKRNRHLTVDSLLERLTGEKIETGPRIPPAREKDLDCD